MAAGADVIGPFDLHWTEGSDQPLRTHLVIPGAPATAAGNLVRTSARRQELFERGGAGSVHRAASGHFDGFQIHRAAALRVPENNAQQSVYFLNDFLPDRVGRFFSPADGSSSTTGRRRQICSLI
jgi:hypothetical protein